jgi:glucosyl-3-phosphoglycerate synthase
MADFHQTGEIATLHSLDRDGLARLEIELEEHTRQQPLALVLPALFSEFEGEAMKRIRNELASVRYVRQIVVALGRADREQFEHARRFFDGLQNVVVLWVSGPRLQRLFELLEANGLSSGEDGKGRSCWLAYGYVLAGGVCDLIALHDCDILSYDRRLLARLCYPVANPNLGFEFCKGYYARVTDRLHGRVTRLLVTPLVRSLLSLFPNQPFLQYLDSFRYPLAGEFAMRTELARVTRIPGDWGLEVGLLAEIYRNRSISRVCQADLTHNYEHKHQQLSGEDPAKGLMRMSGDICKTLFRTLASEGIVFTEGIFRSLEVRYVRLAEDTIKCYYADARLNGLEFDRHQEEQAVAAFARMVRLAAQSYLEDPLGKPLIPNWNRVVSAIPNFFHLLLEAVGADNQADAEEQVARAA